MAIADHPPPPPLLGTDLRPWCMHWRTDGGRGTVTPSKLILKRGLLLIRYQ